MTGAAMGRADPRPSPAPLLSGPAPIVLRLAGSWSKPPISSRFMAGSSSNSSAGPRDTPAMRQYYGFKKQHPDCLLFFRIGDFYEMFDDDAVRASRVLGLTLTQRTEGVPMAGVPFHQLENYVRRCVGQGIRVAVCEQVQDAADVRGAGNGAIIERAVTRVLTPGTLIDDALLDAGSQSLLASVCFVEAGDDSAAAVAVCDLSTGWFEVLECASNAIADELARRSITEVLYAQTADGKAPERIRRVLDMLRLAGTAQPAWHFRIDEAREALLKLYGVSTLAGFGLRDDEGVVQAAGALVRYAQQTQMAELEASAGSGGTGPRRRTLSHLAPPRRAAMDRYCELDATTLRALEVLRTIRAAGSGDLGSPESDASLLSIFAPSRTFPGCRTPMGRRLLHDWLCRPLRVRGEIEARQRAVATLLEDRRSADGLTDALANVQDVARIAGRLALGRASPRDLVALAKSLSQVEAVKVAIDNAPALARHRTEIDRLSLALAELASAIIAMCVDSPPAHLRDGGLIRDGVDGALDEARLLQRDAATWMAEYQARLIAEHDLPSLKVGYNKIFGYFIELPAGQAKRAPTTFSRKQTLKNAERYITPELKEFETKVSTAESRALARELAIFDELCAQAAALVGQIGEFGAACAELDVLACFADKAHRRAWRMPEMVDEPVLVIHQARHPVLDELLGSNFVPNDIELGGGASTDNHSALLALITGPNMAGKSTFIRTAALVTLLAHTGSLVPADRATVGVTDRIFTRIGADDALHAGQSTFMVEMTETARILNHATPQSLVILDEIGRGTSTLDGLSLAWAIAESLAAADAQRGPRTLFATHYHELTDLEELIPGRVRNLHVSVREWGDDIVFLHRILPGRTDQSYGIHVAKLAGIPGSTIARAREVLDQLAVHHHSPHSPGSAGDATPRSARHTPTAKASSSGAAAGQMSLFTEYVQHPAIDRIKELKLEALSPLEAFDALRTLKTLAETAHVQ